MNAVHPSMEITDEFYSVLKDDEVQNRIGALGNNHSPNDDDQEAVNLSREFLVWKQKGKSD